MHGNYGELKSNKYNLSKIHPREKMQSEKCNCTDAECHYQARQGSSGQ